jgi:integrase
MPGCRPLTDDEVDLVLQSFGGRYALRDRALFLLGIYTGFRITELLSLRLADVAPHQQVVPRITVPRRHMKGKYASRSVPVKDPRRKRRGFQDKTYSNRDNCASPAFSTRCC